MSATQLPVVPADVIAERAGEVDAEGRFPIEALDALRGAGLFGLLVPSDCGGLGVCLADTAAVVEHVAGACGSSGMVFTMHLAATQTLVGGRGSSTLIEEPWPRSPAGHAWQRWRTRSVAPAAISGVPYRAQRRVRRAYVLTRKSRG